jgi:hypothetical protein
MRGVGGSPSRSGQTIARQTAPDLRSPGRILVSTLDRHPSDRQTPALLTQPRKPDDNTAYGSSSSVLGTSAGKQTLSRDLANWQPNGVLAWVLADDKRTRRLQSLIKTTTLAMIVPGLLLAAMIVFALTIEKWVNANAAGLVGTSAVVVAGTIGAAIRRRKRRVLRPPHNKIVLGD